jgi:deoxyribonuclease IV
MKFGLKLWSTNKQYLKEAVKLYNQKVYSYIELYVVPESYSTYSSFWSSLQIPYVVHAPHAGFGIINFAKRKFFKKNIETFKEVQEFAYLLNSKYIIVHPGIDGTIEEIIFQINQLDDKRILIENMPYFSLIDDKICQGHFPEEISIIMKQTNVNFCFDIGHAVYAANAINVDQHSYLHRFLKLNPKMYHLTDGKWGDVIDEHLNIGNGDFPLKKVLNLIPDESFITLETQKNLKYSLEDFDKDIVKIKRLMVEEHDQKIYSRSDY